jgi:putative peptidoglycan lipid II flippase
MMVSLAAVAINVALKVGFYSSMGAPGLALATALGAWINFGVLAFLAIMRGSMRPDATLARVCAAVAIASTALGVVAVFGRDPAVAAARAFGHFEAEISLTALGLAGAVVYGVVLLAFLRLFGVRLARPPAKKAPAPHAAIAET